MAVVILSWAVRFRVVADLWKREEFFNEPGKPKKKEKRKKKKMEGGSYFELGSGVEAADC